MVPETLHRAAGRRRACRSLYSTHVRGRPMLVGEERAVACARRRPSAAQARPRVPNARIARARGRPTRHDEQGRGAGRRCADAADPPEAGNHLASTATQQPFGTSSMRGVNSSPYARAGEDVGRVRASASRCCADLVFTGPTELRGRPRVGRRGPDRGRGCGIGQARRSAAGDGRGGAVYAGRRCRSGAER